MTTKRPTLPFARTFVCGLLAVPLASSSLMAYPLDGEARTGIGRLAHYNARDLYSGGVSFLQTSFPQG